jgi:hypothetical protein
MTNHVSEDGRVADGHPRRHSQSDNSFQTRQSGKSIKTVIGVGLLAIVALVLARMHPVPHDIPDIPSWATEQPADSNAR